MHCRIASPETIHEDSEPTWQPHPWQQFGTTYLLSHIQCLLDSRVGRINGKIASHPLILLINLDELYRLLGVEYIYTSSARTDSERLLLRETCKL